jgi:hypothetical protein
MATLAPTTQPIGSSAPRLAELINGYNSDAQAER